jgi:hypothetical protein
LYIDERRSVITSHIAFMQYPFVQRVTKIKIDHYAFYKQNLLQYYILNSFFFLLKTLMDKNAKIVYFKDAYIYIHTHTIIRL